jgi:hypothetical protein
MEGVPLIHCCPLQLVSVTESGGACKGDLPDAGGSISFSLPSSTSSPLLSSFSSAIAFRSTVSMTDVGQFGKRVLHCDEQPRRPLILCAWDAT